MSKLSPEQKLVNKQHQKARNAAFNARRNAYTQAKSQATAKLNQGEGYQAMHSAIEAFEAALRQREHLTEEIRAKIHELEAEIKGLDAKLGIDHLKSVRSQKRDAYFSDLRSIEKEIDEQFQDVAGVFSAALWESQGHYPNDES